MTYSAFRDHDSRVKAYAWNRGTTWPSTISSGWATSSCASGALPRGPDADCRFYSVEGKRVSFLDTHARFHSQVRPCKPGADPPPAQRSPAMDSPRPTEFIYRNDDGGRRLRQRFAGTFRPAGRRRLPDAHGDSSWMGGGADVGLTADCPAGCAAFQRGLLGQA